MNNKAPASTTCRGHLQGCAPGRAASLQNSRTGFKSLRPAFADVAERPGACLVSRIMPVRVRPSALIAPLACDGRHATLRRSKTRFDSWQGHCAPSPRVCRTHGGLRSRKAGFDSRVGDSRAVLFRSLSSECDGRAHDSAKVEDRVQFLARTWLSDRGSKHSRRRSLTARLRSAKPQKRVRLPPAPLSVCPVVPLSWFTRTDRIEHVAVGVGRRELLAPIRRLIKPCPMRVGPTHRRVFGRRPARRYRLSVDYGEKGGWM